MNTKSNWTRGFTLTELLVVLAVIGILAALLLPAISQAKAISLNSGCVSNLRRIGHATQTFVQDHGGKLPGPVWVGQPFDVEDISNTSLPYYLGRYLKEKPTGGQLKTFLCPAYEQFAPRSPPHRERVSLIVNQDIDPERKTIRPFGYPTRWGLPSKEPLNLSELAGFGSPEETYAMTDADKKNSPVNDNPWFEQLPENPVHGHHRNELFFDWHVEGRTAP